MSDNTFTGKDEFNGQLQDTLTGSTFDCPYGDWEFETELYKDKNDGDVWGIGSLIEMSFGEQGCGSG